MKTRQRRKLFSWIAILAILLNTLMPMVSQALEIARNQSGTSQSDWTEVCSVTGPVWVRQSPDGQYLDRVSSKPPDAPASAHDIHCAYCATHAASYGLPPVATPAVPAWSDTTSLLVQYHTNLTPRATAWLAPAVRAPPVC